MIEDSLAWTLRTESGHLTGVFREGLTGLRYIGRGVRDVMVPDAFTTEAPAVCQSHTGHRAVIPGGMAIVKGEKRTFPL